jgi:hypothetical protein
MPSERHAEGPVGFLSTEKRTLLDQGGHLGESDDRTDVY